MKELGHYNQQKLPLYTNNNGALLLAKTPIYYKRTKYILVKYYYIYGLIEEGVIDLIYINILNQKANGLTKALKKIKFKGFL